MNALQQEIITDLGVQPEIDPEQEIMARTTFLADYLASSGMKGYVLGISGGQDSLLAGILAQKAVEKVRQAGGAAEFCAVLLPYGEQGDAADAAAACDFIKPDHLLTWNIKTSVDAVAEEFQAAESRPITDFNKANVKARLRMVAQYAIAAERGLLVIGTDHAAEAVTGFFTKYGDGGADVTPLSGLNKRQGKQLLAALGAPRHFSEKAPTADLSDNEPGRPDEMELGLSYQAIDDYLEGKPIDPGVAAKLEARYLATMHKRSLPVAAPVR